MLLQSSDYYGNEGYLELTPEQWLEEIAYLLKQSWEGYQKFSGKNPAYHREMEINYPKFQDILDYRRCMTMRMNDACGLA